MTLFLKAATALLSLTATTGALPQTAMPKKAASSANSAAVEPAWKVICPDSAAASGNAPQPCSLVQNLVAGEQKQRLLTVIVQRNAEVGHAMTVALPHGVLFPAGVTLQIDDAPAKPLIVQSSDQNGAYAGMPIDDATMSALKGGKSLKVGFSGTNGQRILVPVTLKDFGPGLTQLDKTPLPAPPATAKKS